MGEAITAELADRLAITQVLHDWVFYRDNGKFDVLRTLFAKNGRMTTNSSTHTADEFVAYGAALRERGTLSHHFPGPSQIRINGEKAVAETQAMLMIRGAIGEAEVDHTLLLRYLDRLVREDGAWKIEERHPIYIKDRVDAVIPGTPIHIDQDLLAECPAGCRFLLYSGRARGGDRPATEAVTFNTPRAKAVYDAFETWLTA